TAVGTPEAPITFTSSSSSPSAGDWGSIVFDEHTGTDSKLDYCNISYGSDEDWGLIEVWNNSNTTISNCNISNSSGHGIYINSSTVNITNNIFTDIAGDDVYYDPGK
ncbi:MAG: right-handed parallel beta-helix repeat-containing protein, partial [Bacteroidales bacterium]|nr:right-handed parallel beta-helix repeat-containing protein [Bacteroidales bacterium]